jgi:hypothetical protein
MSMDSFFTDSADCNPLDLAESLFEQRDWLFDRPVEEELVAEIAGSWCHYRIWCHWQPALESLMFSCALDSKIAEKYLPRIYPLLAKINEKLWLGHFEICSQERCILFRYSLLLRGNHGASLEQLEDVVDIAITECDRFYPAIQSVLWGGADESTALEIALMDTVGEA